LAENAVPIVNWTTQIALKKRVRPMTTQSFMGNPGSFLACLLVLASGTVKVPSPDPRFAVGTLLQADDFHDLSQWTSELEKGGKVTA
jgi:hypothetical protein